MPACRLARQPRSTRCAETGVTLRGIYDVSGLRADADVMLWLTGDDAQRLQAALRTLRRSAPLAALTPRWNALGVHRDAEFTRDHAPSFMRGLPPKQWVTVYPFVRSLDWYILPEDERRGMLGEHGRMGRDYPQVQPTPSPRSRSATTSGSSRSRPTTRSTWWTSCGTSGPTEARRHVREEIPFFTGRLIGLDELDEVLS